MMVRTTAQRMAALDATISRVERARGKDAGPMFARSCDVVLAALREYRSWDDRSTDEGFMLIHESLDDGLVAALASTDDPGAVLALLDAVLGVERLSDSVPWERHGADLLRALARRGLSVMWWADRIGRLPDGVPRDLAAYLLDLTHVVLGEHDSGEECVAVSGAFSEHGGTLVGRLVQPVYRGALRVLPL